MNTCKKCIFLTLLFSLTLVVAAAQADDGLVDTQSSYGVVETMDRFEAAAKAAGMTIFSRIDHASAANRIGFDLRPTQLLIFGNPRVGSPIIESNQRAAIDLPLKALAWEDEKGAVWLSYTSPSHLFSRFAIADRPQIEQKMTGALARLARTATQK